MAEALVSLVLDQLGSVLREELEQEIGLVVGVRKQVKDLTTTLTMLQAFLRDADGKQVNDEAVKLWLQELKQIAYDADDVLDEWRTRILLSQFNQSLVTTTPRITKKISYWLFSPCSCFKPVIVRHQIGHKIDNIKARLDTIDRAKAQLNLDASRTQQVLPRRPTSSFVNVAEICGRNDDKAFIVNWLLSESSRQEIHMPVPILSIVGTGGFGKTTLAQLVFEQEKMKFDMPIWVCVSQPFDHEKVAKEIIEQATGEKARNFAGWQALHQQLSDSIKGKQFLIVLDDVWSKNPNDWTPLKLSLDGGAPGSRIIVTTRDVGVAQMMGSRTHRLGELSNQECWFLFQQIAFVGRSQEDRETLEDIGKEIAAKCKGVPLAAKTIASLMRYKQTKIEWRNVLESDIWKLQQGEDGFLPSLLLSYHDLPSDLKQCFLYCAIFPKDEIMEKGMLVKLWMAQGFLGLDGDKELEIIGGDYFDDLAMRSFFQDFGEDGRGKVTSCKMHDLVHDFAQFLTKTECSILETSDTPLNSEKLRHINAGDIYITSLSRIKVKKLRSLILANSKPIHSELFCQVTCLRSLDLSHSNIKKLPDDVEKLLHLRYLDLSETMLTELPETMCNLYNLQTLKLIGCDYLCKLPEGIGRLLNLRHLEWEGTTDRGGTTDLIYFPQGFGKLKHLRSLHKFVVSNGNGGCKLEDLEYLNLISGELEICGLMQVENSDEARRAELQRKADIVSLRLNFREVSVQMITSEENENNIEKRMEEIIEGLQPHNNLERLVIWYYPGLAFPSWMSTMSNITELVLYYCKNCTQLPALGKLPSLRTLTVRFCFSIKQVGVEFLGISESGIQPQTTFPKLTSLKLEGMTAEWEEEVQQTAASIMPGLQRLSIGGCTKLKVIPNYLFSHNLRELEIFDCPRIIGTPSLINLPSLESLSFGDDVGVFSRSLTPIVVGSNLKSFRLSQSPHSSLPQGLNLFKSLQEFYIENCDLIDFNPEEEFSSEHFPNLRKLWIDSCCFTFEPCSIVNWSNLSHISEIYVNYRRIGATESMSTTDESE